MTTKKSYITPKIKCKTVETCQILASSGGTEPLDTPQSEEVQAITLEAKPNNTYDTPKSVWDD